MIILKSRISNHSFERGWRLYWIPCGRLQLTTDGKIIFGDQTWLFEINKWAKLSAVITVQLGFVAASYNSSWGDRWIDALFRCSKIWFLPEC